MHSRFVSVAVLCAAFAAFAAPALALDAFDLTTSRERGMGGRHVALADDFSVLLSNPAGLADVPRAFSIADLGIRAIGPVFDIADLIVGGVSSASAITDFLAANNYKIYAGLDISGPIALGYTGGGLGFGLFNETKMTVNVASASSIGIEVVEDILLAGGYALRLDLGQGNELAAGLSAKGFVRGGVSPTIGIVEAYGLVTDPASFLAKDFTLSTGIGIDVGLRWAWKDRVAAGLACRDIYSPAIVTKYTSAAAFVSDPATAKIGPSTFETLKRSLDLGLMWSPYLGNLERVLDSLVIALDYKDFLDLLKPIPRNPILNASLGLEARVLGIVTLRTGIADTLLSAGAGLDLGVFTLSIAAFGAELGLDPGDRPYYNLLVDFDFKY